MFQYTKIPFGHSLFVQLFFDFFYVNNLEKKDTSYLCLI